MKRLGFGMCLPAGNLQNPLVVENVPISWWWQMSRITLQKRTKISPISWRWIPIKLFTTSIQYDTNVYGASQMELKSFVQNPFVLVTDCNAKPLTSHLDQLGAKYKHLEFGDHHSFSFGLSKHIVFGTAVLTTEKDCSFEPLFKRCALLAHISPFFGRWRSIQRHHCKSDSIR